jgi:hypothetical protein
MVPICSKRLFIRALRFEISLDCCWGWRKGKSFRGELGVYGLQVDGGRSILFVAEKGGRSSFAGPCRPYSPNWRGGCHHREHTRTALALFL